MNTYKVSLRIRASWTENKFLDKTIQKYLQLFICMRAVDNVAVILAIKLSLSTQFTAKKLCGIFKTKVY